MASDSGAFSPGPERYLGFWLQLILVSSVMMQTWIINESVKLAQLLLVRVEKQAEGRKATLLKMSRMTILMQQCEISFSKK